MASGNTIDSASPFITGELIVKLIKLAQDRRKNAVFINEADLVMQFVSGLESHLEATPGIKFCILSEFRNDYSEVEDKRENERIDLFVFINSDDRTYKYAIEFKYGLTKVNPDRDLIDFDLGLFKHKVYKENIPIYKLTKFKKGVDGDTEKLCRYISTPELIPTLKSDASLVAIQVVVSDEDIKIGKKVGYSFDVYDSSLYSTNRYAYERPSDRYRVLRQSFAYLEGKNDGEIDSIISGQNYGDFQQTNDDLKINERQWEHVRDHNYSLEEKKCYRLKNVHFKVVVCTIAKSL